MSAVLDRVRKLIALSASPDHHEGRNAAYLACRLMREHGLDVTATRAQAAEGRAWRPAETPRARVTRGPYTRARGLRGEPRCRECSEPIFEDDGCLDADGLAVHGDCVPARERP
jgi:Protein of unknown function (DUF2786)